GLMSACASATPTLPSDPCGGTITLSFATASSNVGEAAGNAGLDVVLTTSDGLPSTGPSSVSFATANGSATAGSDYTTTNTTVNFPTGTPNGSIQTVNVPIVNDAINEPSETFTGNLSNATGAVIGAIPTHTVTIIDDDAGASSLSIGDAPVTEGN